MPRQKNDILQGTLALLVLRRWRQIAGWYLAAWPSAVGPHLRDAAAGAPPGRIVGVVGDAHERGIPRDPGPIAG